MRLSVVADDLYSRCSVSDGLVHEYLAHLCSTSPRLRPEYGKAPCECSVCQSCGRAVKRDAAVRSERRFHHHRRAFGPVTTTGGCLTVERWRTSDA